MRRRRTPSAVRAGIVAVFRVHLDRLRLVFRLNATVPGAATPTAAVAADILIKSSGDQADRSGQVLLLVALGDAPTQNKETARIRVEGGLDAWGLCEAFPRSHHNTQKLTCTD